LSLLAASVLAIATSAGRSSSAAAEVCLATEGSHSTRRMAMLQVASKVGHRGVVSDLDEGNIEQSNSNELPMMAVLQSASGFGHRGVTSDFDDEKRGQSNSSQVPIVAVGGSGVALTSSVMNADNATSENSSDQLPLITVAAEGSERVNTTDRENSSIAEQGATAESMNNSLETMHVKDTESEEAATDRTQRNVFMASCSVVLPILFLLWGRETSSLGTDETGGDEDDYWGRQKNVGVA